MNWWKGLKGKISFKEPLKKYSIFRAGGPARFFIEPKDAGDLKALLSLLKKHKVSFLIFGNGSNVLISDKGLRAAVLRLSSPYFKKISVKSDCLEAGAGALLNQIVASAKKRSLSGAEFLAGIPGTLGGALSMNAGAWGRSIADLVKSVKVMGADTKIKIFKKKDIKFLYRRSSLAKYIILSGRLKLAKGDKKVIAAAIKKHLKDRACLQDFSRPSLGCTFKNPAKHSAGQLIDLCGLKGRRIGDACISTKHANFILNLKNANSDDYLKLMELIKDKVKGKFNITLKPEIKIWR